MHTPGFLSLFIVKMTIKLVMDFTCTRLNVAQLISGLDLSVDHILSNLCIVDN